MKSLIAFILMICFAAGLSAQTAKPAIKPAPLAKPEPGQFTTYENYLEALVNWKIRENLATKNDDLKCATLRACRLLVQQASEARDSLQSELATSRTENVKLITDNKTLISQDTDLIKKYDQLNAAALEVYNFAVRLKSEYETSVNNYSALTDKYNSLLQSANYNLQQANARLAQQYRFNNALAIYSLMPKYTPPQTINVNVTNCTSFPALCVH